MTTSTRTDRIKGKAQDSRVYKELGFPYIYMIVLPDDDFFYEEDYKDPKKEIRQCNGLVYDANFCNVYKNDNVALIVREKDLFDFLHYITKNEGKDLNKLINTWKKKYYKDMVIKRKNDLIKCKDDTFEKVLKLVNKTKIK